MTFLLRILGCLIGAICLFHLAIGTVGILGIVFRAPLIGYTEILIALCSGTILGALSAALFHASRPKVKEGTESLGPSM